MLNEAVKLKETEANEAMNELEKLDEYSKKCEETVEELNTYSLRLESMLKDAQCPLCKKSFNLMEKNDMHSSSQSDAMNIG